MKVPVKQTVGRPLKVLVPIRNWAVDVAQWVVDYMTQHDRIASSKSINSINVDVIKPNQVIINAAETVQWALRGRKAGKFPPLDNIKQWILDKPIQLENITLNALAFLIGRKIANSGTNPPKLRDQNIVLVIKQKGIKHLEDAATIFAQESSAAWMKSIAAAGNDNVKIQSKSRP